VLKCVGRCSGAKFAVPVEAPREGRCVVDVQVQGIHHGEDIGRQQCVAAEGAITIQARCRDLSEIGLARMV
jgi:hypothetical protein